MAMTIVARAPRCAGAYNAILILRRQTSVAQQPRRIYQIARSLPAEESPEGDTPGGNGWEQEREQLAALMNTQTMTGAELRALIFNKFNRSYECRLQRRGDKMFLHVMWKFLEQRSFHQTPEQYQEQLDAVAEYITMWGVAPVVRSAIAAAKRAPGHTIGGGARAFQIPLDVDVGGTGRSAEWS